MMNRTNLKLVSSQPPEAMMALRLSEVQTAWAGLCAYPYLPQYFFAWVAACDRLEGERLRAVREWSRR